MNDGTRETTTVGEVLRESVLAGPWEMRPDLFPFDPPQTRGYPEFKKRKNHLFKNGGKKRR